MIATTRPEMSVNEPSVVCGVRVGQEGLEARDDVGLRCGPVGADRAEWRSPRGGAGACERVGGASAVPAGAPVVSCYEAGRDGFWIHRALTQMGVRNRVVDSASIEVNRRARRAKTDRLDALKLVRMLVRVCCGERRVWSEVRVPSVADEAARQVSRERTALDAGADAAGQSDARLAGDVGVRAAGAAAAAGGGRRCAIGRARRCRPRCKRGWRAPRRAGTRLEAQIAELEPRSRRPWSRRRRPVRCGSSCS